MNAPPLSESPGLTQKSRRPYLTVSLRTLFVLTTALAVWLGVVVNRAREQREAVKAIEALGGQVLYGPFAMLTLRRSGNDYFQSVEVVNFPVGYNTEPDIREIIPHLQRLRGLKTIFWGGHSERTKDKLRKALPNCVVNECSLGGL